MGNPENKPEELPQASNRLTPPPVQQENLVYQCDDFSVWLSERLDVWWETKDSFKPKLDELQKRTEWGEIIARQTELEALPMSHLSEELKRGFRFQIGNGIFLLLTEKFEQARRAMAGAEAFYRARTAEKARMWILESSLLSLVVVSVLVLGSVWVGATNIFYPERLLDEIVLGAFAGALGTFVSLVCRISMLGVDATAGKRLHYAESGCRVLVGLIAGGLSVCAIAAGVIAPGSLKVGPSVVVLFGFVAGFSERWLPSLVGAAESSARASSRTAGGGGSLPRSRG